MSRKTDHLILDAGAVAGPHTLDDPGIHGGFVEVGADEIVRGGGGVGDVAGDLFHVEHGIGPAIEGENVLRAATDGVGHVGKEGRGLIPMFIKFVIGKPLQLRSQKSGILLSPT